MAKPGPLPARQAGKSKFGTGAFPWACWTSSPLSVQLRFGRKPMLFFGGRGAVLFLLGFLVGVVALWLRFGPPTSGSDRCST